MLLERTIPSEKVSRIKIKNNIFRKKEQILKKFTTSSSGLEILKNLFQATCYQREDPRLKKED